MTRKHFRALAQALYEVKPKSKGLDPEATPYYYQWIEDIYAVARVLGSYNKRFDSTKFIHACRNGL